MAFFRFRQLPPEIRNHVWKDALEEEAVERLFFLHRWTFRILPTKNNISPLFSVSLEARAVAKSFYDICVPVHRLPPRQPSRELISCNDWLARTSKVRWGKGIGSQGQSWTNRERYWYHYALTLSGETAQGALWRLADETCSPSGCVYFNATTDRFLLSYDASTRDKAEHVADWGNRRGAYAGLFVEDPQMDVCVYQMTHDQKPEALGRRSRKKKHSPLHEHEVPRHHVTSRFPEAVKGQLRNIVFVDVKDDSTRRLGGDPQVLFGSTLGDLWGPLPGEREAGFRLTYLRELETRSMQPAGEDEVDLYWCSCFFPAILQPPRTVFYLEILASRSCNLVGEVEKRTAKCLDIVELKIDGPEGDDGTANAESGNTATKHPHF
ncbi:hypothetical protein PG985_003469 [Apiospora marii]|uniref:2EXR domain-containing protein n=1 Tax=Apiospora marii TaxID=335849 RepID=A0ABR1SI13_9PEZI